jgi:hypothetical protein
VDAVPSEVGRLAHQIVQGKTGQREKALALYDWIAQNIRYDIASYLAGDLPDPSPEVVLSSRLTVCEGYARLFVAMATSVGLEAVMIPGFSKGFAPGDEESRSEPDHAWNAVKIADTWLLLDATWGSGHIDEKKDFVAQYTRDWFAVAPEQFATTHFPSDPKWQLLQTPMSENAFWAQPSLSRLFFKYGLHLESHPDGEIVCERPFEMQISSDKECRLMASLYKDGAQLEDGAAMVERRGTDFTVSVSPPQPGKYRLVIFAGPPEDNRTESAVVYNLKANSGGEELPKTLKSFSDQQVHLVEPRSALRRGQSNTLVLEAPGATKLLAVAGSSEVHFKQQGDRFSAQVTPSADKVMVYGSYDDSTNYTGLLEFPVSP